MASVALDISSSDCHFRGDYGDCPRFPAVLGDDRTLAGFGVAPENTHDRVCAVGLGRRHRDHGLDHQSNLDSREFLGQVPYLKPHDF